MGVQLELRKHKRESYIDLTPKISQIKEYCPGNDMVNLALTEDKATSIIYRKGLLLAIWASGAVRFLKPLSTGPGFVSFFASCRPGRGFSHPQQLHLRGRSRAHTSSSSCGKEDLAVPEKYILAFLRLGEARVAERVRSQEEDL
ncbi:hypothetical protein NC652_009325 [Populus alba x Populus x berolinensis]|uniref:Uncharacterized protein n=2 Tax=Populus TaxID=3689 RepID=A0A4U5NP55_POPAL|nr:hypothetical protein NC652_009325 [Populus alba x Populus x berolinensis]KAJ7004418.1 hypothetical protein NC653_009325 [Populus alba x Populus x berolinensis]TKR84806.1 hypothetical protein D5086_0000254120 [Populus alba]